ncbi:MAG: hypothetical protein ACXAD7_08480 [Candidatus Kariarchaeaceae archaeon]
MNNNITKLNIPISSIYILNDSGTPLFARHYQGEASQTDSVLIAGFLSAIEIFTRTSLGNKLTDIGMEDGTRFFFERSAHEYMSVASSPTDTNFNIDPLQVEIMQLVLAKVNTVIDIIVKTAASHGINVNILGEGLGNFMDSLILEATLEFSNEVVISSETSYIPKNFESGTSIDTSEFSKIISSIGEKVKKLLD